MILVLFLMVGLFYVVVLAAVLRWRSLLQAHALPLALAVGLAAASIVLLIIYLHNFLQWQQPIELAWTGIHSTHPGSLHIGGKREETPIGWPSGFSGPQVTLSDDSTASTKLTVTGGDGFVKDGSGHYLNGTNLLIDQPVPFGEFSVIIKKSLHFGRCLYILDKNRSPIERFDKDGRRIDPCIRVLPPLSGVSRSIQGIVRTPPDRVVQLDLMLVDTEVDLRADQKDQERKAQLAAKLEAWADGIRILETGSGEFRLLVREPAATNPTTIELPSSFTVLWPNHTMQVEVARDKATGRLALEFAAPWRQSSPLFDGTQQDRGDRTLVPNSHLLPDDHTFELPFGEKLDNFRCNLRSDKSIGPGSTHSPMQEPDCIVHHSRAVSARWQAVTYEQSVRVQPHERDNELVFAVDFKAVRDGPSLRRVTVAMAIGLLCFAFSIRQSLLRMRPKDRWILSGFGLSVWLLFLLRCHFALRYAIDPRFLDPLAVSGVTYAFILLAIGPGAILLAAPLWRDQYLIDALKKQAARGLLLNAIVLGIAVFIQAFLARSLWPNLPASYSMLGTLKGVLLLIFEVLSGLLLLLLFVEGKYIGQPRRASAQQKPTPALRVLLFLRALLVHGFTLFYRTATETGPGFWRSAEGPVVYPAWLARVLGKHRLQPPRKKDFFYQKFGYSAGALLLVLAAIGALLYFDALGTRKWSQEIIVPLLFCWLPACLLLSSRKVFAPNAQKTVNWWRYILIVAAILLFSVLLFRVAVYDVGGIFAALSVFAPIAILLLVGGRSRIVQLIPCGLMSLALLFSIFLFTRPQATIGLLNWFHAETAAARILAWSDSAKAQSYLPLARMSINYDAPVNVTRRHLADAIEHTQENLLMAGEGGFTRFRYGTAPTRRSQVRQDTLQYDSAFSFFVVGENGWIGGGALLLIYFLPMVFVLISGREVFDIGHGLAYGVAGSFVLSALIHAAMNWGVLPFTGRNLPILSVNSLSDASLWIVLLSLAVQSMLWRVTGSDEVLHDADSIMMPQSSQGRHWVFSMKSVALLAVPLAILVWSGISGIRIYQNSKHQDRKHQDSELNQQFAWRSTLDKVDEQIRAGEVRLKGNSGEIESNPKLLNTLLGQEIARFNALSEDERRAGPKDSKDFENRLYEEVHSIVQYDQFMKSLHKSDVARSRHPLLFKLATQSDGKEVAANGQPNSDKTKSSEYRLEANPDFFSHVSFKGGTQPKDFPKVELHDGATGTSSNRRPVVGPAWSNGGWVLAYDPDPLIPWARSLKEAVSHVWDGGEGRETPKHFAQLTLDASLQQSVQKFIGPKGRKNHADVIEAVEQSRSQFDPRLALPPRVALSIVNLPSGEVLALGGWPRMTSGDHWISEADGTSRILDSQIPDSTWLEEHAPQEIRTRYHGDRNFDRLLMGSSTKPLWAAAVLAIHPHLAKELLVRAAAKTSAEGEVFGIRITDKNPWKLHPSKSLGSGRCCDFDSYLAKSDNRYHIRLGFLGLAKDPIESSEQPFSDDVSIDGGKSWRKQPKFPEEIGFSGEHSKSMRNLDRTPLAQNLRDIFEAGVFEARIKETGVIERDMRPRRYSFWTADESDDRPGAAFPFASISPEAPQLKLNEVTNPRDYVNLLLGGKSNAWANIDFAGAFATAVLGKPVTIHITKQTPVTQRTQFLERTKFLDKAKLIRPGLEKVITDGTAAFRFKNSKAMEYIDALKDKDHCIKVYAKTGTLEDDPLKQHVYNDKHINFDTSRFVMAIVREDADGNIQNGLVLSLVIEHAVIKGPLSEQQAAQWMVDFLGSEGKLLCPYLVDPSSTCQLPIKAKSNRLVVSAPLVPKPFPNQKGTLHRAQR